MLAQLNNVYADDVLTSKPSKLSTASELPTYVLFPTLPFFNNVAT